jgi:FkbM family methyltransferase
MGKERRQKYFIENHINLGNFLLFEWPIKKNGIKAIPRKDTADYDMLFGKREKEIELHLRLYKGETFVDVGSNVGYYTLKAATDYGEDINIVAIEAHPENYKALCRNIACNGFTNIAAINKAVSENKGIVTMSESLAFGYRTRFETYSINNNNSSSITDASSSLQVECDTLDNILAGYKVDLMKIDIEGAEVLALKAATNTLKGLRKIIVEIHEYNFDKVKQILELYNFKLEIIGEDWGEKKMFHGYIIGSK